MYNKNRNFEPALCAFREEKSNMSNKVLVETSARHVHVTQQDLETLFGKGAALTPKKDLSQPGQFAARNGLMLSALKKPFPA